MLHGCQGGNKEDNTRCLEFLKYCDERRQELKRTNEEDAVRKGEAQRKTEAWNLMRISL